MLTCKLSCRIGFVVEIGFLLGLLQYWNLELLVPENVSIDEDVKGLSRNIAMFPRRFHSLVVCYGAVISIVIRDSCCEEYATT